MMRVLYIYRNPAQGFSITKVFKTLEQELRKHIEIDILFLPAKGASMRDLYLNIRTTRRRVREGRYDVVHITGGDYYLTYFLRNLCSTMVTVHDLGFYVNHKLSIKVFLKYIFWIKVLKHAKCLTFISDKTKKEVMHLVDVLRIPHQVISNPVDPKYRLEDHCKSYDAIRILHIGAGKNKNLENTAKALQGSEYELRIIGKLSNEQVKMLEDSQIKYSNVFNLTDDEIYQEYVQCDLVNFPSLYEGFGMPIIEAQSIGRPVITSTISPMMEIAGQGAILVDPHNPESIREGYQIALERYDDWVWAGLENVQRFSAKIIAEQYLKLYSQIVHEQS